MSFIGREGAGQGPAEMPLEARGLREKSDRDQGDAHETKGRVSTAEVVPPACQRDLPRVQHVGSAQESAEGAEEELLVDKGAKVVVGEMDGALPGEDGGGDDGVQRLDDALAVPAIPGVCGEVAKPGVLGQVAIDGM